MGRVIIKRNSDETIFAIAPRDPDIGTLLNDAAGASSVFKVYDPSIDESLSADVASAISIIPTTNHGLFKIGYGIEITQDDDTIHASSVISIDIVNKTVTINDATTDTVAEGNRIRVIFGSAVTMAEFGTPVKDTRDWGYRATLLNNQAAHKDVRSRNELDIDVEVKVNGGVGLIATDVLCYTIKGSLCV